MAQATGENVTKVTSDDNGLSRQVTYQMSPEQYERLFLQPSAAKGDLAKRLGMILTFFIVLPEVLTGPVQVIRHSWVSLAS